MSDRPNRPLNAKQLASARPPAGDGVASAPARDLLTEAAEALDRLSAILDWRAHACRTCLLPSEELRHG